MYYNYHYNTLYYCWLWNTRRWCQSVSDIYHVSGIRTRIGVVVVIVFTYWPRWVEVMSGWSRNRCWRQRGTRSSPRHRRQTASASTSGGTESAKPLDRRVMPWWCQPCRDWTQWVTWNRWTRWIEAEARQRRKLSVLPSGEWSLQILHAPLSASAGLHVTDITFNHVSTDKIKMTDNTPPIAITVAGSV